MKKFKIPCTFGGNTSPVTFYIGNPEKDHHPIQFQADWLSKERGGTVPAEIMKSLEELKALSDKNGVPFEELCSYALESIQINQNLAKKQKENDE
ncbi:DUF2610 domain-containing protein [Candidatus Bandiella euplotis]|nr:DUF2610 domain-containing protein [Candidatus Bandiella woodruffii]